MAIILNSKIKKDDLVLKINELIYNGKIDTWFVDGDGDYTHVGQWQNKAWFKAYDTSSHIIFGLIGRKDEKMTKETYAVYHGRLLEMLLAHFDNVFIDYIKVTSEGWSPYDKF